MLNLLCRRASNSGLVDLTCRFRQLSLAQSQYASFTLRDVLHERSDEAGTLQTCFAKHIALERYKDEARELVPTTIRYADFFPITDERYFQREILKTEASQLPALIIYASSYRSNAQPPKYAVLLNELDAQATSHVYKMTMHTVLETLYSFLFLIPNWIMRLDFYEAAIKRLVLEDFKAGVAKEAFVQICFYLGMNKNRNNNNSTNVALIEKFLNEHLTSYLPQLTNMDLAIVANAAYKTSTVVRDLPDYGKHLIDAVLQLELDNGGNDALLVTYVKSLRLQRIRSDKVCERISELCQKPNELQKLQLRGLAHLFAYLVEQQWDQPGCIDAISQQLFAQLPKTEIRAKDLATFCWCLAQFNCNLTPQQLKELESLALQKLDNAEYRNYPDNLVDTCLSLWTLGCKSRDLFDAAVELKSAQMRRYTKSQQPKVDTRLTVLTSAVAIEQPSWIETHKNTLNRSINAFNASTSAPGYLLKERTDLKTLSSQLSKEETLQATVKIVCPIDGINIPSLLLSYANGSKCFIVLLNDKQTLKFSQAPLSLIRLKQRLLEALNHKVITINSNLEYKNILEQLLANGNGKAEATVTSDDDVQTARSI